MYKKNKMWGEETFRVRPEVGVGGVEIYLYATEQNPTVFSLDQVLLSTQVSLCSMPRASLKDFSGTLMA